MSQALDAGGSFDAGAGGGSHFSFAAPVAGKSDVPEGDGGEVYGTWIQKVRGRYGYFTRSSDLIKQQGARRKRGAAMEGGEPKGVAGRPEVGRLGGASTPPPFMGEKARPLRLVMPAVYPSSLQSSQAAMARYRQEMMELVRGVPESAYELSLRDLVEVPRTEAAAAAPTREEEEEEAGSKERGGGGGPDQAVATGRLKKVKSGKKKIIPRSTSVDGGVFLLKMFFPPSLGWRRRSSSSSKGAKVSPKPVMAEAEKRGPEKEVDTETLERSGEKSTRNETKNSGQRRKGMGCYPFSLNKGRIRYDVGMNQENDI